MQVGSNDVIDQRDEEHGGAGGEIKAQDPAVQDPAIEEPDARLAEVMEALRALTGVSEQYHLRAAQREAVIDQLHEEVDRLRRGERRGVMRPLLTEACRLREDLLRQADALPTEFDAEQASLLLRSYADSVEIMLENNGVVSFTPDSGDSFDPRLHRRVGQVEAPASERAGHVAHVRRRGYLDLETKVPISPAEVTVYGAPLVRAEVRTTQAPQETPLAVSAADHAVERNGS